MNNQGHIVIGEREYWGQQLPFVLSHRDRRHHLYTVGKSGAGKTTLLRNLILQDIEAGHGIAIIDPHGDLANELLDCIPRRRIEDVAYFNPSDMEYPIGFNLLGYTPPEERHLVASGIVSVFKSIWSDSWGPRLEYILYASVAALLDCENVSLLGVQRMLSDGRYRSWVVKQIKDPMVRSFWENEFENYDKKFMLEAIAPIQNKVGQLLMSPHLRNILGQPFPSLINQCNSWNDYRSRESRTGVYHQGRQSDRNFQNDMDGASHIINYATLRKLVNKRPDRYVGLDKFIQRKQKSLLRFQNTKRQKSNQCFLGSASYEMSESLQQSRLIAKIRKSYIGSGFFFIATGSIPI